MVMINNDKVMNMLSWTAVGFIIMVLLSVLGSQAWVLFSALTR